MSVSGSVDEPVLGQGHGVMRDQIIETLNNKGLKLDLEALDEKIDHALQEGFDEVCQMWATISPESVDRFRQYVIEWTNITDGFTVEEQAAVVKFFRDFKTYSDAMD